MRVTVTGATGAVGLASVRMLVRAGHQVRAFVRSPEEFWRRSPERRVEVVEGDILDRAAVAAALDGADAVVQCVDFPARHFARHWDALLFVREVLAPQAQLIYPGNVWVYGPPQSERVGPDHPKASPSRLGSARADLEKAVVGEGGTVVHFPDIYGPGIRRGRARTIFERALAGRTVRLPGDLDRAHELIYVGDAARALVAALAPRARGREYTAPGVASITPREFVSLVFRATGQPVRLRSLPIGWLRAAALLHPDARALRDLLYLFECSTLLDGTRIRSELGWMPEVDYAEGIRRTLKWYRREPVIEAPAQHSSSGSPGRASSLFGSRPLACALCARPVTFSTQ